MSSYLVAGNWKMNLDRQSAVQLAEELRGQFPEPGDVELAVFPPSVYLEAVGGVLHGGSIGLGAQNVHAASDGAFTGEVSCSMVADFGCRYVILGHSERRTLMGETDAMVAEKVLASIASNLVPIVCLGESLEQREAGQTQTGCSSVN